MTLRLRGALCALCVSSSLFAIGTTHSNPTSGGQLGLPMAAPESVGFSKAGLDALNKEMHALVDAKKLAAPYVSMCTTLP